MNEYWSNVIRSTVNDECRMVYGFFTTTLKARQPLWLVECGIGSGSRNEQHPDFVGFWFCHIV